MMSKAAALPNHVLMRSMVWQEMLDHHALLSLRARIFGQYKASFGRAPE